MDWIAELAERSVESAHDRVRIDARLAHVRDVLESKPASCIGEGHDYKQGENISVVRN